jgi:hypothetical protein
MSCAENVKSVSMSGFGGNGAGCRADEEPLGGAANTAPYAAASSDAQSVVAFARKSGGFVAFISEVALGRCELGLAGFAVNGEVVEGLQIFSRNDGIGFWRWRVWKHWSGLQNDWRWQGDLAWEFADNLGGGDDSTFLGGKSGEGLRELRIAVVLASVGRSEELLGRGKL